MSLDDLGEAVGTAPSQLSLIENGKKEPKLSLLRALARALGVSSDELLGAQPPNRRVALEIELERAQRGRQYHSLGLPSVKPSSRIPTDVLEALVGLHREVERQVNLHAATPEEARRANTELRKRMRDKDNYFGDIESEACDLLGHVGYTRGPLSQHQISDLAAYLRFTLHHVDDLPHSTRSVTDLRNRRIYLEREQLVRSITDDVIGYAQANNITQIVIGKSTRSRWLENQQGKVVHHHLPTPGNNIVHGIAGTDATDTPVGLAVGSFFSISLEPPLIGFCVDEGSSSWPRIAQSEAFCVNVLGADQEDVCRVFASKDDDKFAGIGWETTETGSPRIHGSLAWIDCELDTVHDAGDHQIVIGRVKGLDTGPEGDPLVFFRGGYANLA
jgi:flavin reductase (DIM6/NTAB) family NADH-FMN oxidoreductase RutF/transcriptional regulator with XRE-family HTH domain